MTTGINVVLIVIYWPLAGQQGFGRDFWDRMKNYSVPTYLYSIAQFGQQETERRLQDMRFPFR